jgi:NTE family protein
MNAQDPSNRDAGDVGLVLTGGGARGAYQVGVLRWLARNLPDARIPILTGVSAGALNAAKLAASPGDPRQTADELAALWTELTPDRVFRVDPRSIASSALRWGARLISGGGVATPRVRGFLDTAPLRELLEETLAPVDGVVTGIDYNLHRGRLRALAIVATSYSTGQTVTFACGRDLSPWSRPQRRAIITDITIDHVMASAALPVFFPAIQIGEQWYGDGGVRLAAPLSPALHLGASRILAVSTRYDRSQAESDAVAVYGYPPPAQVLGVLLNAVFLDLVDQDAGRLERLNKLIAALPPEKRMGMRIIRLLVLRPSRDLGRLAADFEPQLPRAFRFMTRGLGTRETRSPDLLSMLMFQPDYLSRLIDIGEQDAERRSEELRMFFGRYGDNGDEGIGG